METINHNLQPIDNNLKNLNTSIKQLNILCDELLLKISSLTKNNDTLFESLFSATESIVSLANGICTLSENTKNGSEFLKSFFSIISNISSLDIFGRALIGTIALLDKYGDAIYNAMYKSDASMENIRKKTEALDEQTEAIKRNTEATQANVSSIQADYSLTLKQIDDLVSLTGENGVAGNVEKAKYLAEQINKVLPDAVKITEDNKVAWNGNTETIKENIKELQRKSILEAQQGDYAEALSRNSQL